MVCCRLADHDISVAVDTGLYLIECGDHHHESEGIVIV